MQDTTKIPISSIVLDESIYPRGMIDRKRVAIFAENIRDNFRFDPIEVEPHPDMKGKYRILDGVHRWCAYKATGVTEPEAIIKGLDGIDPLLYAAAKAIGPRQLTEEETRNTARRAFQNNPGLTSSEIGKAIGRSRQAVDSYIADLRATVELDLDLKIFRMNRLGIPQDRIGKRLGQIRETIRNHLAKMPGLAKWPKADLIRGFTVRQVAEKHGWPEIEPCHWDIKGDFESKDRKGENPGFLNSREKPDLIIFDPPYFGKKAREYPGGSISSLPRQEYLGFLERFFSFMRGRIKKDTRLAFINADWRNFQNTAALDEGPDGSIMIDDYLRVLNKSGWRHTHIIQAPLSADRFTAGLVAAMQKGRILGVTSRYVIVSRPSR